MQFSIFQQPALYFYIFFIVNLVFEFIGILIGLDYQNV